MIGRNLLSGFASSGFSALLGFLFVPLYIKYLGIESYGLIGFFATMQAVLALLDMGIAPTMNREAARSLSLGKLVELGDLLRTLSLIYWAIGILVLVIIIALAPFIAAHWLQSSSIDVERLGRTIMLMGLVFSCRWPISLYQSTLIGMQRIQIASFLTMSMALLGNLGALITLAYASPSIEAFFIWQVIVAILNVAIIHWVTWSSFKEKSTIRFQSLKSVWKFSAGMSGIAFSSIFLMQLDKILLSKMLPLEIFGYYSLAVVFAGSLSILIGPVFNVIYPRLSALVVEDNEKKVLEFYMVGTQMLAGIIFPVAFLAAFFSEDILYYWIKDVSIVTQVTPIASLLFIGGAINGVMILPYALQLAHGMTRLPLFIVLSLIGIYGPLTYYMVLTYGAIGGALSWLILNALYLLYGPWLTHRYLLKNSGLRWFFRGVLVPASISLMTIYLGWSFFKEPNGHWQNLFLGILLASIAILMNYSLLPTSVHQRLNLLNKVFKD